MVMSRKVANPFGLEVQFHGIAKGLREEKKALAVVRPVGPLAEPCYLGDIWREVIGRALSRRVLGSPGAQCEPGGKCPG